MTQEDETFTVSVDNPSLSPWPGVSPAGAIAIAGGIINKS